MDNGATSRERNGDRRIEDNPNPRAAGQRKRKGMGWGVRRIGWVEREREGIVDRDGVGSMGDC